MKRKPDILWILVFIFGLGGGPIVHTQRLWDQHDGAAGMAPVIQVQQAQQR